MKTLNFEQMELVQAGSLRKTLSCISQVAGGMDVLWSTAAALALGFTPVGMIVLGFGLVSLIAGGASDPTACD
jgi:hypothetical protein